MTKELNAFEKKAEEILQQEITELINGIKKSKLYNKLNIEIGGENIPLSDTLLISYYTDSGQILNPFVLDRETRKQEIIKELLDKGIEYCKEKDKKEEEKKSGDVILDFLSEGISTYNSRINNTISDIDHGYINSTGNEINIYKEIVFALSYIKKEYEDKIKK